MNTKPINTKPANGEKKKWTRASLIAAVATGAITTEAANLLLSQVDPTAESISEVEPTPQPELTPEPMPQSDSIQDSIPEPIPEQEIHPQPEHSSVQEADSEHSSALQSEPDQESMSETDTPPAPQPELPTDPIPESEDIVDVIVEEIDPHDIDMEDILLVDDIGTVYTVEGEELNAALIHDQNGNQAVMVDADNDNVYDVIATPEGELIAQVPGDIDVSDVEILYAQQHGHTGYIEQNDFDTAMNDEPDGIQEDISLT